MVDIVTGAHISDAESDTDSVASTTTNLTVRVFAGGYISPQFTFFLNAIEALHPLMRANGMDLRPVVEIQHVQDMRLLQWSPNDLVDLVEKNSSLKLKNCRFFWNSRTFDHCTGCLRFLDI